MHKRLASDEAYTPPVTSDEAHTPPELRFWGSLSNPPLEGATPVCTGADVGITAEPAGGGGSPPPPSFEQPSDIPSVWRRAWGWMTRSPRPRHLDIESRGSNSPPGASSGSDAPPIAVDAGSATRGSSSETSTDLLRLLLPETPPERTSGDSASVLPERLPEPRPGFVRRQWNRLAQWYRGEPRSEAAKISADHHMADKGAFGSAADPTAPIQNLTLAKGWGELKEILFPQLMSVYAQLDNGVKTLAEAHKTAPKKTRQLVDAFSKAVLARDFEWLSRQLTVLESSDVLQAGFDLSPIQTHVSELARLKKEHPEAFALFHMMYTHRPADLMQALGIDEDLRPFDLTRADVERLVPAKMPMSWARVGDFVMALAGIPARMVFAIRNRWDARHQNTVPERPARHSARKAYAHSSTFMGMLVYSAAWQLQNLLYTIFSTFHIHGPGLSQQWQRRLFINISVSLTYPIGAIVGIVAGILRGHSAGKAPDVENIKRSTQQYSPHWWTYVGLVNRSELQIVRSVRAFLETEKDDAFSDQDLRYIANDLGFLGLLDRYAPYGSRKHVRNIKSIFSDERPLPERFHRLRSLVQAWDVDEKSFGRFAGLTHRIAQLPGGLKFTTLSRALYQMLTEELYTPSLASVMTKDHRLDPGDRLRIIYALREVLEREPHNKAVMGECAESFRRIPSVLEDYSRLLERFLELKSANRTLTELEVQEFRGLETQFGFLDNTAAYPVSMLVTASICRQVLEREAHYRTKALQQHRLQTVQTTAEKIGAKLDVVRGFYKHMTNHAAWLLARMGLENSRQMGQVSVWRRGWMTLRNIHWFGSAIQMQWKDYGPGLAYTIINVGVPMVTGFFGIIRSAIKHHWPAAAPSAAPVVRTPLQQSLLSGDDTY